MKAYTWKRRNTYTAEYVSTYPADVWVIRAVPRQRLWSLRRAGRDGDAYVEVGTYPKLAVAQQAAVDWMPPS
jgi:hypothetical protein